MGGCPCPYFTDPKQPCKCSPTQIDAAGEQPLTQALREARAKLRLVGGQEMVSQICC